MKTIETLTTDQERAASMLRALGNPARMRIVAELAHRSSCVRGELAEVVPLSGTTLWQHLRVLQEAGIVRGALDGEPNYCLDTRALRWIAQYCFELASAADLCLSEEDKCC